jgi:hypothetical protein
MPNLAGPFVINNTGFTADNFGAIIPYQMAASTQFWQGGALMLSSGKVTPLVATTAGGKFAGTCNENVLTNSSGGRGTQAIQEYMDISVKGVRAFAQTGTTIDITKIGSQVWFSDDHTVTLTPGSIPAGIVKYLDPVTVTGGGNVWVEIGGAVLSAGTLYPTVLTGTTDAISPTPGVVLITGSSTDATTLAAPAAGVTGFLDIMTTTAHAHTITSSGNLQTGGTAVNVLTAAAQAGCGARLFAYNQKWIVEAVNNFTAT